MGSDVNDIEVITRPLRSYPLLKIPNRPQKSEPDRSLERFIEPSTKEKRDATQD